MENWRVGRDILSTVTIAFGLAGLSVIYFGIKSYFEKKKFEKADLLVKTQTLKKFPTKKMQESGAICCACQVNPSNVIAIPCNHLALCNSCYG